MSLIKQMMIENIRNEIVKTANWKFVRNLGVLRFSKTSFVFIALIPVLLKVTEKFVNPLVLVIQNKEYIFQLELPFNWFYLYFGAIFISLGSLIYLIFCPKIVKEFNNYGEYEVTGKPDEYLFKYLAMFDDIEFRPHLKFEVPYVKVEGVEENLNKKFIKELEDGTRETSYSKMKVDKGYTKNLKYYEDRRRLFNNVYQRLNKRFYWMIVSSQFFYYIGFVLIGIILIQNLIYIISYLLG